ncbi:MAG: uncharacterized protein QOI78_8294 [Actinomycetota bacterium]|jgi:uncharacterized membrane protein YraQ (UPF0718 family)|nr:uncharacterized protein [Actinomycetota bacterium]
MTEPAAASRSRSVLLPVVVFAVVAVAGLAIAKWLPYGQRVVTLSGTRRWAGSSMLRTDGPAGLAAGWHFLVSYAGAIWLALVAAVVLGAATEALLPRQWLLAGLGRGPWAGALFALPTMMCTCCTAPVVSSLRRGGVRPAPAVAYWLGNPVLNPAVLVFLVLVGPWQWAASRLLAGIALVLGAAFLAGRLRPAAGVTELEPPAAERAPAARFLRALARFALVLVPEYAVVVFAVGALGPWLFPPVVHAPANVALAVVLAIGAGLLIVIPTGGEIPVLLGLAAAGASPVVLGVLLITLPAISLPSMLMVGRALSWRTTAATAACVALAGLAGGLLLSLLGS